MTNCWEMLGWQVDICFLLIWTIYNNVVNRQVNDDKLVDTICPPPCRVSRKLKHHPATMTAPSPFRTLLAVLLLTSLQLSSSFTTGSQRGTSTISCRSATSHGTRDVDFLMTASNYKQSDESTDATFQPYQKKMFISSILSILLFLSLGPNSITPPHANAIQEKNEALCNTGFFTTLVPGIVPILETLEMRESRRNYRQMKRLVLSR